MNTNPPELSKFHELLTGLTVNTLKPWYFALQIGGKDPLMSSHGWKDSRACLSIDKALEWMSMGYNIGIAATSRDSLVIMDVDDPSIISLDELPTTLTTVTRTRLGSHHFYFASEKFAKMNIATDDAGEIRSVWQYVVAPGSFVPVSDVELSTIPDDDKHNAGKYTVGNAVPPVNITFNEFPSIFRKQFFSKFGDTQESNKSPGTPIKSNGMSELFSLTITDIFPSAPRNQRFSSPFHNSHTGANTSITNDLLHCWRHSVSHNALSSLAVLAGIDTCLNAGVGHSNSSAGPSSINLKDGKTMFEIWIFAKNNGYIPNNDPIPSSALTWFSLSSGYCSSSDLINGWQLPTDIYYKTIAALQTAELLE